MELKARLVYNLLTELSTLKLRNASHTKLSQLQTIVNYLKKFEVKFDLELYTDTITTDNLIDFGFYIKKYRSLSNSSVIAYLNVLIIYLREKGNEIIRRKVIREFPVKEQEIPEIPEDIIRAILDTQIPSKDRHVLDAIKLIILHGFRYSDLWVLQKDRCILEKKKGVKYFKYYPPKNRYSKKNKNGVTVVIHPIGEQIIKFWSKLRTESYWNEERAPKGFKDKDQYPHLEYVPPGAIGGYHLFKDPIIKIPHHLLDRSIKKRVFEAVHETWETKYMYEIKNNIMPHKGLKEIDPETGKELWETFSYHTFRHVYCSRFLAQGGNVVDLRDNVGHSSIAVTQKYVHTVGEDRLERSFNLLK